MPSRIGDNVEDSDDNDVIDDDDAEENYVKDLVKLNWFARRVPVYDLGSGCGPGVGGGDGGGDDDGNEETSDHREAAPRLEARSPKVVIGRITVTHCVVGHASPD